MAHRDGPVMLALTFDYGQRASGREIERAGVACKHLGISHKVIELPWLAKLTKSALVNRQENVPKVEILDLQKDRSLLQTFASQVWVPNRNGVFVNIAACYAEQMGASRIVAGFNREEAGSFPDNGKEFIMASTESLSWSTRSKVELWSYLSGMEKADIVTAGIRLGVDFSFLWSCYHGGELMCGTCESCSRLIRAFCDVDHPELLPPFEGGSYAKYLS